MLILQDPVVQQDSTLVDMGVAYGSGEDLAWALLFCVLVLVVVTALGEHERRSDAQRSERRMAKAKRAVARWRTKPSA